MLCQNCQKNEADRTFIVNFFGGQQEVHLCSECLEQMWRHMGAAGQRAAFSAMSGWWAGRGEPRSHGESPFPQDAGRALKARRQIAALRTRLEEAVLQEKYEEAAGLRDRIAAIQTEQEVGVHES